MLKFGYQEKLHLENVDASVAVLRKLTNEWKDYADKISLGTLRETINHLRAKVHNFVIVLISFSWIREYIFC